MAEFEITNSELRKYNDLDQEVTLVGIIFTEPDVRENNTKLVVKTHSISQTGNSSLSIKGKILITTKKYPEYEYGDKLKIQGRLLTPKEFEDFNYRDYLAKDSIYSVMYEPEIELINKNQGNFIYSKILSFKQKLRESVYQTLSPPQSLILGAMILGDKSRMSTELKEKLNISGLRHITAVSGMHVVILTGVLMSLLIGLGLWRGQAFYLTLVIIFLFIVMTGCQPSGIRAGIMGGLFLLGQKVGRLSISSRAIVFTATIMLISNPLLLLLDVGFQLSFLAVMGIIYLGPVFGNWLKFIPEERFLNLRSILVMTFTAQILTLPILIYNFGIMSVVSPLTNVLIIPTIYWIMIFGFIFGILGIVWQPLAQIFSLPCWILLTYLTKIVDFFSEIPWVAQKLEISWILLVIFYLILGSLVWLSNKKKLKKSNFII